MTDPPLEIQPLGPAGGSGPLVVLVHGMEDLWPSWRPLASALDPTWRVLALDPPWRSGNDYSWRRQWTAGGWLSRALAGLDEPVDLLVGHSLGGNAVLEVLATPGSGGARAAALLAPFYCARTTPITWALFDYARRSFDRIISDGMRMRLGPRVARLDPELCGTMLDKMVDRIGPQGFVAWFDHFVASGRLPLATVSVPTVVLASGEDPCLADGRAQSLAADMPAATLWLDETYDHFCHVRQARQVAAQLIRFVGNAPALRARPGRRRTLEGNRA